ncbi:MAG: hypothetical protein IPP59_03485 [Betaproteobacteria bacterium]|nr:hypothetical protein [Candidatus Dechloromonas phosphorivorans]
MPTTAGRFWPGDLFLAYPGDLADGRRYIADALARGAVAVLWQPGAILILEFGVDRGQLTCRSMPCVRSPDRWPMPSMVTRAKTCR